MSFEGIVGLIKALLKFALVYLGSDQKQKEENKECDKQNKESLCRAYILLFF